MASGMAYWFANESDERHTVSGRQQAAALYSVDDWRLQRPAMVHFLTGKKSRLAHLKGCKGRTG